MKRRIINVFLCLVIGGIALIAAVAFLIFINKINPNYIIGIKIISYGIIALSVIVAIFQLRENIRQSQSNSNWNKKQITIQQLHQSRITLAKLGDYINEYLNTKRKKPYKVKEIHSLLGVAVDWNRLDKTEDKFYLEDLLKGHIQNDNDIINAGGTGIGLRFVFFKNLTLQGKELERFKELMEKIILTNKDLQEKELDNLYFDQKWKNYDGKKLYRKLHSFLSEYEYIGTSLNKKIFDIDIVESLMHTSIIKAYETFNDYINHLRNDHNPLSSESTLYKEFEKMVEDLKEFREKKGKIK